MSEMIERVARAISDDLESQFPERGRQTWDQLSGPAKASYRRRARAAIEAMREPNEAMRRVGIMQVASNVEARVISHGDRHLPSVNVDNCIPAAWPAMIDEALK